MEIYILRDGERIGPFSKDAARILIEQDTVSAEDMAWHKGSKNWRPLEEILKDVAKDRDPSEESSEPPELPPPCTEPASAAQIAFLSYFSVAIPSGLMKDAAEKLITQATEDPQNVKRLTAWEVDRLRLHPDLFNTEVHTRKEDRVQLFYDLCHTAGADHFTGVTKAHCQVLVAFLDVKFPRWDANQVDATERYFFPAIAEKFPQLVNKAWRGKLHYGTAPHIAGKEARKPPTAKPVEKPVSAFGAIVRGVFLGLFILAVLYLVYLSKHPEANPPAPAAKPGASAMRSSSPGPWAERTTDPRV
jgi:hypothetical protein